MSAQLLDIDIGTSSSKAILVRRDGVVLAEAERPHHLPLAHPGWAEHDAANICWGGFQGLCQELRSRVPGDVVAVCASGIGPYLPATDERGTSLRPAILCRIDSRAREEIDELNNRYGQAPILERCGSPLTSQAVRPKLLWLRPHEHHVWQRMRRWFMAWSFLVHRLTDEYILDHHSASQADPLYDISHQQFIESWAQDIAPGLELPRLVWPWEVTGRVTPDAGTATGPRPGTLERSTPGRGGKRRRASPRRSDGDVWINDVPRPGRGDPPVRSAPLEHGLEPDSRSVAAGMAASGTLTNWLRQLAGSPPYAQLLAEAASADGLVIVPYFSGRANPDLRPPRPMICGLTRTHGRGHLYRAALEATAYGVRHNLETMADTGARPERAVAVGGGTRGQLWTRIACDVIGQVQQVPRYTRGASYGDALLAARAAGRATPDTDWCDIATTVEPDQRRTERDDEFNTLYRKLYPASRETAHALAGLQQREAVDPERSASLS